MLSLRYLSQYSKFSLPQTLLKLSSKSLTNIKNGFYQEDRLSGRYYCYRQRQVSDCPGHGDYHPPPHPDVYIEDASEEHSSLATTPNVGTNQPRCGSPPKVNFSRYSSASKNNWTSSERRRSVNMRRLSWRETRSLVSRISSSPRLRFSGDCSPLETRGRVPGLLRHHSIDRDCSHQE